MKPKIIFLVVFVAALAGMAGWLARQQWPAHSTPPAETAGRKIKFYQSAMHPWVISDKPGKCTVCGMDLVPVFEGDPGFDATAGLVTLSSNAINVIHVQTVEVLRQPLRRTLRVAGVLDDNDARHRILSAYVDGRIDKLFINYTGAEVVEGQPLAMFYSAPLLVAGREYVTLARQPVIASPGPARTEQQALLSAARQRLKLLGLSEKQIAALPEQSETNIHAQILAPMTGTVVARNVYEGQYVKEGEKLFELGDFSTMWFKFDAYERDLVWLKPGQSVEVTTPAVPGKTFPATINFIDPNLVEMTRSAKVRAELANPLVEVDGRPRRELFHKLYAEAVVRVDVPETLAITRSAVLSPSAQPVVYVDKGGGAYEQRRVKLGRVGDELVEVLEGLAAGEHVVTTGNLLLDSQTQLNSSAASSGETVPTMSPTNATPTAGKQLTAAQETVARDFLITADAVTRALSSDNLADFNQHARKLREAVVALKQSLNAAPGWQPLLQRLEASSDLSPASDLPSARKSFHPFSTAAVEFAKKLRAESWSFATTKIFHCPMVKQSFPGAPKTGVWIQLQSEIRNPYFGAEMLDCGSEVKP